MPREMLGYFSGLKLNAWDSVSPPPSEKKCNNSEALCCEGDNEEVKAPEGPSSGQVQTCPAPVAELIAIVLGIFGVSI